MNHYTHCTVIQGFRAASDDFLLSCMQPFFRLSHLYGKGLRGVRRTQNGNSSSRSVCGPHLSHVTRTIIHGKKDIFGIINGVVRFPDMPRPFGVVWQDIRQQAPGVPSPPRDVTTSVLKDMWRTSLQIARLVPGSPSRYASFSASVERGSELAVFRGRLVPISVY